MDVKKIAVLAVAAVLVFFVISQPGTAAGMVHTILGMLASAAESLITFVSNVVSG
ncbi:MAG: hypothetical protein ACRDSE_19670 [Pseudonocardiaceae bacterium]